MKQKKIKNALERHYISELDLFLQAFDKKPEAYSETRYAEQAKYEKIGQQRDNPKLEQSNIDLTLE